MNWKGGKKKVVCEKCSCIFYVYPYRQARFCSRECNYGWRAGRKMNKDTKIELYCLNCNGPFKVYQNRKDQKFCTRICYWRSQYLADKTSKQMLGKVNSLETRKKLSDKTKGSKHPRWRGGITNKDNTIRNSFKYRSFRKEVLERDNYQCIWCSSSLSLQVDHIKPFAYFPEHRFDKDNARTLCIECHKKTDTYMWKAQKLFSYIKPNYDTTA